MVAVRADEVLLVGTVADETEHRALLDAVRGATATHRVTDLLAEPGSPSPLTASTAAGVVAAAVAASAHDLTAVATVGTVTAHATAPDEQRAATLREALSGLGVRDPRVDVGLASGPVAGPEAGTQAAPEVDLAALQRSVTAMIAGNGGFRFAPSTAEWQGHGPVLVDRVGRLLLVAPKATITLNGHASAGQPDAQGLARRRAEAVRALFVAQGVRAERIRTAVVLDVAPENTDPAVRQVDVLIS